MSRRATASNPYNTERVKKPLTVGEDNVGKAEAAAADRFFMGPDREITARAWPQPCAQR